MNVKLQDHVVLTGDGYGLPASRVAWFSLMDANGNLREKPEPRKAKWPLPKSDLRPWGQLIDSMRETPRSYGGQKAT